MPGICGALRGGGAATRPRLPSMTLGSNRDLRPPSEGFIESGSLITSSARARLGRRRMKPRSSSAVISRWMPDLLRRSSASFISSKEGGMPLSFIRSWMNMSSSCCLRVSIGGPLRRIGTKAERSIDVPVLFCNSAVNIRFRRAVSAQQVSSGMISTISPAGVPGSFSGWMISASAAASEEEWVLSVSAIGITSRKPISLRLSVPRMKCRRSPLGGRSARERHAHERPERVGVAGHQPQRRADQHRRRHQRRDRIAGQAEDQRLAARAEHQRLAGPHARSSRSRASTPRSRSTSCT